MNILTASLALAATAAAHPGREPRRIDPRVASGVGPRTFPIVYDAHDVRGVDRRSAMDKRAVDVGLTNFGNSNYGLDSRYTLEIEIGTPPQTVPVILDSWYHDLTVYRLDLTHSAKPTFDSTKSATYSVVPNQVAPVVGLPAVDVVKIGDATQNQSFTYYPVDASSTATLGFGFPYRGKENETTPSFWDQQAPSWTDKQIGLYFKQYRYYKPEGSNLSMKQKDGGGLTIGGVNSAMFTGDINYMSLPDSPDYWHVPLQGVAVNGHSVDIGLNKSESTPMQRAIISTGEEMIRAPANATAAFYSHIPGARALPDDAMLDGYWMFPCNTTDVNITFTIGAHDYPITIDDLAIGQWSGNSYGGFSKEPATNGSWCIGAIMEFKRGANSTTPEEYTWTIGTAFLKNVYTAFRFEPYAVGFAALSEAALKTKPTSGVPRVAVSVGALATVVVAACAAVLL